MGMMPVPMSLQEPDFMIHGVLKTEMFGQELWITTTTVGSWIITATLLLIAWIASRKLKKVNATDTPGTFQCVLEMGMNHFGEIEYLSGIVEPDVALITNIGDAHIERLGSRENIFKAKCELLPHIKPDGLVILNGDDALLTTLRGGLPFQTVFCGTAEGLEYRASQV